MDSDSDNSAVGVVLMGNLGDSEEDLSGSSEVS